MRVSVKLFAMLSRYAQGNAAGAPFEVEVPEGATLQDLLQQLNIPPDETKIVFVNGVIQSLDCRLNPEDIVGIFPPIAGG